MGSRNLSPTARISALSRSVPYLKQCCCCVSLTHGIQAITVSVLIFGGGFMFLANELITPKYAEIMGGCFSPSTLYCLGRPVLRLVPISPARAQSGNEIPTSADHLDRPGCSSLAPSRICDPLHARVCTERVLQSPGPHIAVFYNVGVPSLAFTIYSSWVIKSYIHVVLDRQSRPSYSTSPRLEVAFTASTHSIQLNTTTLTPATGSPLSERHVSWKGPLASSSFSKLLDNYKIIKESQSPTNSNREEKTIQANGKNQRLQSNGITLTPMQKAPETIENVSNPPRASSSRRPSHFEKPSLQVLFMTDQPKYKSKMSPTRFQQGNRSFVSDSQNIVSSTGLLETPKPFSNYNNIDETEPYSQPSQEPKSVCFNSQEVSGLLSLSEDQTKIKNKENYAKNQHDKEQQTTPKSSYISSNRSLQKNV